MKAVWKSGVTIKRIFAMIFVVLLTTLFVFWPLSPGDLHIRLYFEEITGDKCALYYTTDLDGGYSEDRCIVSPIEGGKQVDFRLDASLAGHIQNLRIDWPNQNQLLCVKSVTVSSAGVVQKEFNPCDFFSNIVSQNDIADQSIVRIRKRAYILTEANDPYMIWGG